MRHLQGGVRDHEGKPIRTKKTLKEAALLRPHAVTFYDTSAFNPTPDRPLAELEVNTTLTIVGPDPYTKRQWYAIVQRKGDRIVVT
jgi:hypothetical protein